MHTFTHQSHVDLTCEKEMVMNYLMACFTVGSAEKMVKVEY